MSFFLADNIISSLGFNTRETFSSLLSGEIGIKQIDNKEYYPEPFPASMIDENRLNVEFKRVAEKYSNTSDHTKLEKMLIVSIDEALSSTNVNIFSTKTAIILSTTKGNINLLASNEKDLFETDRVLLWKLGDVIRDFFENPNQTIVISNACISGVLAINTAAMYINSGLYDNVVVTGGDIVSRFVVSGFMSFLSLSPTACKPFDEKRDGLSLGEAAATIILGYSTDDEQKLVFKGGASANDANHISGPSRNGEGSYIAIKKAIIEAKISTTDIDHISAHGTATPYNDEMENIAIDRHNLCAAPVNSIKGYLGHTLGAAGIVETAILLEEMRQNTILKTAGFNNLGVSKPIFVTDRIIKKDLKCCLKMASGFGGSNAALIITKTES
ncbi:MAG: beta-ketoacyl synthase [Bacteroidetes bacterium]|nr:beta-ketoacyl synthase [Bacteroidota bacterium]